MPMASPLEVVIVHSSDLHLGVDDSFSDHDRLAVLPKVLTAANKVGADVVVLAGDTFDNHRQPLELLEHAAQMLRDYRNPSWIRSATAAPNSACSRTARNSSRITPNDSMSTATSTASRTTPRRTCCRTFAGARRCNRRRTSAGRSSLRCETSSGMSRIARCGPDHLSPGDAAAFEGGLCTGSTRPPPT